MCCQPLPVALPDRSAPAVTCKLLRAIAGYTDAHRYRYDTILIGAAETIEAFERAKEDQA